MSQLNAFNKPTLFSCLGRYGMKKPRYVLQISFTHKEHLQLIPILKELQVHTGMNKSTLMKRMIAYTAVQMGTGI